MNLRSFFCLVCVLVLMSQTLSGCNGTAALPPSAPAVSPTTAAKSPTATSLPRSSVKLAAGPFEFPSAAADSPSTFGLVFIIEQENRNQVAAYSLICGGSSGPSLPGLSGLMGTDVAIDNGKFIIDNEDVLRSGEVVDPVTIQGSVAAKSPAAFRCGIRQTVNGLLHDVAIFLGWNFWFLAARSFRWTQVLASDSVAGCARDSAGVTCK